MVWVSPYVIMSKEEALQFFIDDQLAIFESRVKEAYPDAFSNWSADDETKKKDYADSIKAGIRWSVWINSEG